jgi:DNA-binding MarR family transcriptional regulator
MLTVVALTPRILARHGRECGTLRRSLAWLMIEDENAPHDGSQVPVLAAELRVALLRAARRVRAERSDEEVSVAQFSVLAYLERQGPATPGAIAEFERVRPPSLTRTLTALEALGLIERLGHPADGRQVLVRLTPTGRDLVLATRSRRDAWLARRIEALTADERALLAAATDVLRRIADS